MLKFLIVQFLLLSSWVGAAAASPLSRGSQKILGQPNGVETIVKALINAEVIPDVLPPFPPKVALHLNYLPKRVGVDLGNEISVPATAEAPLFDITPLNGLGADLLPTPTKPVGKTLTLVLTDPDATSRVDPVKGQMCHWIMGGIRFKLMNETQRLQAEDPNAYTLDIGGASFDSVHKTGQVESLKELIEYLQPAPPPKTGRHRYVFVLLEAEEGRGNQSLEKPSDRPHWGYEHVGQGVMDWAKDNGLVPIGANFFYAQDEHQ